MCVYLGKGERCEKSVEWREEIARGSYNTVRQGLNIEGRSVRERNERRGGDVVCNWEREKHTWLERRIPYLFLEWKQRRLSYTRGKARITC